MSAYYNEIEPYAAQWLRNLIAGGHIAPGDVDEREIQDVSPDDLKGYDQCHFFAGIGGWSRALRIAGWPDDRPVWTGSCPCQPFSSAGKQSGFADERHLWPFWHYLIEERRPPVVFGEQVASGAAKQWLDLVSSDLEGLGYAFGAASVPAGGVGAPHIRQRAWFVADRDSAGRGLEPQRNGQSLTGREEGAPGPDDAGRGRVGGVADACDERRQQVGRGALGHEEADGRARRDGSQQDDDHVAPGHVTTGELAEFDGRNASPEGLQRGGEHGQQPQDGGTGLVANQRGSGLEVGPLANDRHGALRVQGSASAEGRLPDGEPQAGPLHGFWRDADWLLCRDGKWRPVEPGTFPLADGVSNRVGKLRAYGNAIVPEVAAAFIRAAV